MAGREERLAVLETTMNEHSQTLIEMRESMTRLEQRMDSRFDRLDDKVSRVFAWVVGIQVTVLVAVIGSLLSLVAILAPR